MGITSTRKAPGMLAAMATSNASSAACTYLSLVSWTSIPYVTLIIVEAATLFIGGSQYRKRSRGDRTYCLQ